MLASNYCEGLLCIPRPGLPGHRSQQDINARLRCHMQPMSHPLPQAPQEAQAPQAPQLPELRVALGSLRAMMSPAQLWGGRLVLRPWG